jgi:UDP-N-acetylmuramoylalanine--D-glutamate ligase
LSAHLSVVPYRKVWVGGNIGSPLIAHVDEMVPGDLAIVELSSFQLELMNCSPNIAVVLNITPNHLDRHGSMQAYTAAKAHILTAQKASDVAVLNRDDPGSWELANSVPGNLVSFGLENFEHGSGIYIDNDVILYKKDSQAVEIVRRQQIGLRGAHNLANVMAASAACLVARLPVEAIAAGVKAFQGVPHRLELVLTRKGVRWYNDSIATAPERTMAAIHSFDEPLVLLLGGRDKKLPWEDLIHQINQRVRHLILFGEFAPKIEEMVHAAKGGNHVPMTKCSGLHAAIQAADQIAQSGDVILLSPGGTSFDEFRDFEERGECFKQWVMQL